VGVKILTKKKESGGGGPQLLINERGGMSNFPYLIGVEGERVWLLNLKTG